MGDHSSRPAVADRLKQPTRTTGRQPRPAPALARARHPYSVLLPVGFAMPLWLPIARCALAAPFHPCLTAYPRTDDGHRRSALCGTVPDYACLASPIASDSAVPRRSRRALPGTVVIWSPDFPRVQSTRGRPTLWHGGGLGDYRMKRKSPSHTGPTVMLLLLTANHPYIFAMDAIVGFFASWHVAGESQKTPAPPLIPHRRATPPFAASADTYPACSLGNASWQGFAPRDDHRHCLRVGTASPH